MRALALGLLAAVATFFVVAALTGDDDETPPARTAAPAVVAAGDGRAVFARMGCGNCHTLAEANSHGQIGPSLDARLTAHSEASLRAIITDPPGDLMPDDFGQRMDAAELDALIAFLLSTTE